MQPIVPFRLLFLLCFETEANKTRLHDSTFCYLPLPLTWAILPCPALPMACSKRPHHYLTMHYLTLLHNPFSSLTSSHVVSYHLTLRNSAQCCVVLYNVPLTQLHNLWLRLRPQRGMGPRRLILQAPMWQALIQQKYVPKQRASSQDCLLEQHAL